MIVVEYPTYEKEYLTIKAAEQGIVNELMHTDRRPGRIYRVEETTADGDIEEEYTWEFTVTAKITPE